ncbi:MAG: acetyl-CoA carboxylase biotin carboxyl carrier protein [Verrucomicrobiota bacterium]|nr:MAG: acetyl-CoA carboxylase biotin carboxyl carrier protein [Verrucomicrobiota bacterium]
MEKKDIEDLIAIMERSSLAEIEIADGNTRIVLRKNIPTAAPVMPPPAAFNFQPQLTGTTSEPPVSPVSCDNYHIIKSPMVGTFYSAPSPESEPFVQVGSHVDVDTPVCILEAMKVMNEIQSDVSGTIREILVKNGQAVEFGQPLFRVEV